MSTRMKSTMAKLHRVPQHIPTIAVCFNDADVDEAQSTGVRSWSTSILEIMFPWNALAAIN